MLRQLRFFQNLAPWSPVPSDFYAHHENHHALITEEPMLCCVILMVSSRHHVLPGPGGPSRAHWIHHRLWQQSQSFITRLMFGQEKGVMSKSRSLGSCEALLLLTEWHSQALHFPPDHDGWDLETSYTTPEAGQEDSTPSQRWLQEVIEPARRSDRMSWMLLGSALALAHELGVFDGEDPPNSFKTLPRQRKKERIRKLLYVYVNQLSSRLGCASLMPANMPYTRTISSTASTTTEDRWTQFMTAWIELTKLVKEASDVLFPSAAAIKRNLYDARYIRLLERFRPMLASWKSTYLDSLGQSTCPCISSSFLIFI